MSFTEPDDFHFPQFEHITKPRDATRNHDVIDVEPIQTHEKMETFFEEMLSRLEDMSQREQLRNSEPKRTPALYLGRRVKE